MDVVRIHEQAVSEDQYGNRSHYDVSFERRRAVGGSRQMERVALVIRCNGIERVHVEMPGEVGVAMMYAVRQAFEKFDIEAMSGRKVDL